MAGGYMRKLLWVDLTTGKITEGPLDEGLCHDFLGGYGIGARVLYNRMKPGTEPLGPENILDMLTGISPEPVTCTSTTMQGYV